MAEFTLKPREADTLKLNIGDKSYQIPLGNCLTPAEAAPLDTQAGTIEFIRKYIDDEEIKASLRICDYNEITKAWVEASKKAAGKNPGE